MVLFGVGCDLAHIARMSSVLSKYESRFLQRALHPREIIRYYHLNKENRLQFIASRWALKEAVLKAFGQKIRFNQIELEKKEKIEKPVLVLHGETAKEFQKCGICKAHVSISHESDLAMAVVLLECESDDKVVDWEKLDLYRID